MPSPRQDIPRRPDGDRWPPLLLALRRTARPDRARVDAYVSLTHRPTGWSDYTEFLAVHRAWIVSLDRALAEAGLAPRGPPPDAAEELDAARPATEVPAAGLSPPRSRAHALGYLYVLEAFRLGCAVLARRIRGMAGPAPDPERSEQDTGTTPWAELARALGSVSPEEHPAVLQGAREAFSAWEERLAASLAHLGLAPPSSGAHAA